MASARGVVLALVLAAGCIGVARAQDAWPGQSQTPWPPPSFTRQECMVRFTMLRSDVERAGMAAKDGAEKWLRREQICKLVTAYWVAEISWMTYAQMNMTKCGIPRDVVDQINTVHARTADGVKKLCLAGAEPQQPQDFHDDYRLGPPTQPINVPAKSLPRFSGR